MFYLSQIRGEMIEFHLRIFFNFSSEFPDPKNASWWWRLPPGKGSNTPKSIGSIDIKTTTAEKRQRSWLYIHVGDEIIPVRYSPGDYWLPETEPIRMISCKCNRILSRVLGGDSPVPQSSPPESSGFPSYSPSHWTPPGPLRTLQYISGPKHLLNNNFWKTTLW